MVSNSHCAACLRVLSLQFKQARKPPTSIFRSSKSRRFSFSPSLSTANSAKLNTAPPPSPLPKSNEPPKPLGFKPAPSPPPKSSSPSKTVDLEPDLPSSLPAGHSLAAKVRKIASGTTETYIAFGACDVLVKECARQADYTIPQALEKRGTIPKTKDGEDLGVGSGQWYEALGLSPTFNTWAQVTFLHMYALVVRMRAFPAKHVSTWHQHLVDHFFYNAEERMISSHRISARSIRNKYLKDLFLQWRGLIAAYDEGLARGSDAVLATAVWRNVFKADEEVDLRNVGLVVSYLRGILNGLESVDDEGIAGGDIVFGDLRSEREGVLVTSRGIKAPFVETDAGTERERAKKKKEDIV